MSFPPLTDSAEESITTTTSAESILYPSSSTTSSLIPGTSGTVLTTHPLTTIVEPIISTREASESSSEKIAKISEEQLKAQAISILNSKMVDLCRDPKSHIMASELIMDDISKLHHSLKHYSKAQLRLQKKEFSLYHRTFYTKTTFKAYSHIRSRSSYSRGAYHFCLSPSSIFEIGVVDYDFSSGLPSKTCTFLDNENHFIKSIADSSRVIKSKLKRGQRPVISSKSSLQTKTIIQHVDNTGSHYRISLQMPRLAVCLQHAKSNGFLNDQLLPNQQLLREVMLNCPELFKVIDVTQGFDPKSFNIGYLENLLDEQLKLTGLDMTFSPQILNQELLLTSPDSYKIVYMYHPELVRNGKLCATVLDMPKKIQKKPEAIIDFITANIVRHDIAIINEYVNMVAEDIKNGNSVDFQEYADDVFTLLYLHSACLLEETFYASANPHYHLLEHLFSLNYLSHRFLINIKDSESTYSSVVTGESILPIDPAKRNSKSFLHSLQEHSVFLKENISDVKSALSIDDDHTPENFQILKEALIQKDKLIEKLLLK